MGQGDIQAPDVFKRLELKLCSIMIIQKNDQYYNSKAIVMIVNEQKRMHHSVKNMSFQS